MPSSSPDAASSASVTWAEPSSPTRSVPPVPPAEEEVDEASWVPLEQAAVAATTSAPVRRARPTERRNVGRDVMTVSPMGFRAGQGRRPTEPLGRRGIRKGLPVVVLDAELGEQPGPQVGEAGLV